MMAPDVRLWGRTAEGWGAPTPGEWYARRVREPGVTREADTDDGARFTIAAGGCYVASVRDQGAATTANAALIAAAPLLLAVADRVIDVDDRLRAILLPHLGDVGHAAREAVARATGRVVQRYPRRPGDRRL